MSIKNSENTAVESLPGGGPAFPCLINSVTDEYGTRTDTYALGISKREHIAIEAMKALIIARVEPESKGNLCKRAYMYADVMLEGDAHE